MTSCNTLPEPRSPRVNRDRQKVVVLKIFCRKGFYPKKVPFVRNFQPNLDRKEACAEDQILPVSTFFLWDLYNMTNTKSKKEKKKTNLLMY